MRQGLQRKLPMRIQEGGGPGRKQAVLFLHDASSTHTSRDMWRHLEAIAVKTNRGAKIS